MLNFLEIGGLVMSHDVSCSMITVFLVGPPLLITQMGTYSDLWRYEKTLPKLHLLHPKGNKNRPSNTEVGRLHGFLFWSPSHSCCIMRTGKLQWWSSTPPTANVLHLEATAWVQLVSEHGAWRRALAVVDRKWWEEYTLKNCRSYLYCLLNSS